jgi:hypothetical protein
MYLGKIAAALLASAVMELPWFVLPTSVISVALLVRDAQAQSASVSRMPLAPQPEINDYTNAVGKPNPLPPSMPFLRSIHTLTPGKICSSN